MNNFNTTKLPIPSAMHATAYQIARIQPNETAARKVYTNHLAVRIIAQWCDLIGLEYSWEDSTGANAGLLTLSDVAGLMIPGFGSIECRIAKATDAAVNIPESLVEDDESIGCFVLRLLDDNEKIEEANMVELLGFTPQIATSIALTELNSIDSFFVYHDRVTQLQVPETEELKQLLGKLQERLGISPEAIHAKLAAAFEHYVQIDRYASFKDEILGWLGGELTPAFANRGRKDGMPNSGVASHALGHALGHVAGHIAGHVVGGILHSILNSVTHNAVAGGFVGSGRSSDLNVPNAPVSDELKSLAANVADELHYIWIDKQKIQVESLPRSSQVMTLIDRVAELFQPRLDGAMLLSWLDEVFEPGSIGSTVNSLEHLIQVSLGQRFEELPFKSNSKFVGENNTNLRNLLRELVMAKEVEVDYGLQNTTMSD